MPGPFPRNQYNPPDTLTRSSHSITIKVRGQFIGMIQGWGPQQSRQITPVYEINSETSGLPLENVPGNVQNLVIQVQRVDLWPVRMEQAFGTVDLTMLSNQQSPFQVQEEWVSPSGGKEVWQYEGCWFESIGRTYRSDDTRIVNVNAQLRYVYKTALQKIS